jgi:hypothetical protein
MGTRISGPYNYTPIPYHSGIGKTSKIVTITSLPFTFTGSFAYPYALQLQNISSLTGSGAWVVNTANGSISGSAFYVGETYNIDAVTVTGTLSASEKLYALYQ